MDKNRPGLTVVVSQGLTFHIAANITKLKSVSKRVGLLPLCQRRAVLVPIWGWVHPSHGVGRRQVVNSAIVAHNPPVHAPATDLVLFNEDMRRAPSINTAKRQQQVRLLSFAPMLPKEVSCYR